MSRSVIIASAIAATISSTSVIPSQAKLIVGPVPMASQGAGQPTFAPRTFVDPDRLFRSERRILWAGESNPVRDCVYGDCGVIDAKKACG
jgi:hypothetical protein